MVGLSMSRPETWSLMGPRRVVNHKLRRKDNVWFSRV